jgi:2-C-methyl-D-erythritol 4-phosphate cytidylyltransferase
LLRILLKFNFIVNVANMEKFIVIVAGGIGGRMGTEIPKQFLLLHGKPVLMHTMEIFYRFDPQSRIILVLPENQCGLWKNLCFEFSFSLKHQVVNGGKTRFDSVKNGLAEIDREGVVFIHDGVRPLVSTETLERCFETATSQGNAIPVVPVIESLRKLDDIHSVSVDRSAYVNVQTPQTFIAEQILKAYKQDFNPSFTDDASVAERAGFEIHLVAGNSENIKITTPIDLIVAESLLEK